MATLHVEIVTPMQTLYSGDVAVLRAPGLRGLFGVLPRHIPYMTALGVGEVNLTESGGAHRRLAISGGFLEVLRTGVTALAETAEFAESVDVARAEAARDRAQERLARRLDADVDVARAEAALARALNRLRVAERGGG